MIIPKLSPTLESEIITGIIGAVGRTITIIYVTSRDPCPVCSGNDPFCAQCGGNRTNDTVTTRDIVASVKWKDTDSKRYTAVGQFIDGDCVVKFPVPLEDYGSIDALLKSALSITVDGRVCVIDYWSFGGSPINRVSVVLNVDASTSGQRIG